MVIVMTVVVMTVVVMTVVVMTVVVVNGGRVFRGTMTMAVIAMLDRIAARMARMRAEDGDQAGQDRAQQRQKDDCLNH